MNVPIHHPATDYRRRAAAVRAVANSISLNDVRQELLEAARRLEAQAEEEERKARTAALSQRPQSRA